MLIPLRLVDEHVGWCPFVIPDFGFTFTLTISFGKLVGYFLFLTAAFCKCHATHKKLEAKVALFDSISIVLCTVLSYLSTMFLTCFVHSLVDSFVVSNRLCEFMRNV